jgi:hypothetical protein
VQREAEKFDPAFMRIDTDLKPVIGGAVDPGAAYVYVVPL